MHRVFRQVSTADGIPSDRITALARSPDGLLWMGTTNGLACTDGWSMEVYHHDPSDSTGLPLDHISALAVNGDRLYIGTFGGGVAVMDLAARRITRLASPRDLDRGHTRSTRVKQLLVTGKGELLAATENGTIHFPGQGAAIPIEGPSFFRHAIHRGHDLALNTARDTLWHIGPHGIVMRDLVHGTLRHAGSPGDLPTALFAHTGRGLHVDRNGFLWSMHMKEPVLQRLDPRTGGVVRHDLAAITQGAYTAPRCLAFVGDPKDRLWITDHAGHVVIWDIAHARADASLMRPRPSGPQAATVSAVLVDAEDRAHLGTDQGLWVQRMLAPPLLGFWPSQPAIGDHNSISAVVPYGSSLFIGTRQGFFSTPKDASLATLRPWGHVDPAPDVNDLQITRDGTLHVSGYHGVWTVDTIHRRLLPVHVADAAHRQQLFADPKVGSVLRTRSGDLWVSTWNNGLFRLMPTRSQQLPLARIEHGGFPYVVLRIREEVNGDLLLCCNGGGGIWRYAAESRTFTHVVSAGPLPRGIPDGTVTDLLVLRDGRWLIGTLAGGTYERRTDGTLVPLPRSHSGISAHVHRLLEVPGEDAILILGPDGIQRYDVRSGRTTVHDTRFPSGSIELSHSGFIDRDGLLVGFNDEVIYLLAAQSPVSGPLRTTLHAALADGGKVEALLPHDADHLRFTFSAVDHDRRAVRFEYQLDGIDATPRTTREPTTVHYANLPAGEHVFRVHAVDDRQVHGPQSLIAFRIEPPFWRTWWATALLVLIVAAIGYSISEVRRRHQRNMQRTRNVIARDLHDDIGSSLSSISLYSDIARRTMDSAPEKAQVLLEHIQDSAQRSITGMADIIWAIQPQHDTAEDLLMRMKDHAHRVLEARGIRYYFDITAAEQLRIGMKARRDVFLLHKEAINNIIKHSRCTEVGIRITITAQEFTLRIHDNGKGIGAPQAAGTGMASMRARTEGNGGRFTVRSEATGTTITAVWPIPMIRH